MKTPGELKASISQVYTEKLQTLAACCGAGDACGTTYPIELLGTIPEGVVSFGCGNLIALAGLRSGEVVLDLGSGTGLDCFLAAREVGPEGSIVGVDFTPAMVEKAQENAAAMGIANVSFRLGDIESIPVEDAGVDVVISNCVINLAQDKDAVFREAFRILRGGGRLMVSDIVLTRPATQQEAEDIDLLAGCISGSLVADDYLARIRAAGFEDIHLDGGRPTEEEHFWFSAAISATKP